MRLQIGPVKVGSAHRIALQTMTTTDTRDIAATVEQVRLADGCGGCIGVLRGLHLLAAALSCAVVSTRPPLCQLDPRCCTPWLSWARARPSAGQEVRRCRCRHCAHHRAGAMPTGRAQPCAAARRPCGCPYILHAACLPTLVLCLLLTPAHFTLPTSYLSCAVLCCSPTRRPRRA